MTLTRTLRRIMLAVAAIAAVMPALAQTPTNDTIYSPDIIYSPIPKVGLSGEIRTVTRIEQRVTEAQKLGFETIFIPKGNLKGIKDTFTIKIIEVGKVEEVFQHIFQ